MARKTIIRTSIVGGIVLAGALLIYSLFFVDESDYCTSFSKIENYNMELNSRVAARMPFGLRRFTTKFVVDRREVEAIVDNRSKYVLAVFGVEADTMNLNILGSNEDGDGVTQTLPNTYDRIKSAETRLIRAIEPVEVRDEVDVKFFPLVVKLDTLEFMRLIRATDCTALLLYVGIQPGSLFRRERVTIGIAAADRTRAEPDAQHKNGNLCAAETWPSRNFTLAKRSNTSTDIILP